VDVLGESVDEGQDGSTLGTLPPGQRRATVAPAVVVPVAVGREENGFPKPWERNGSRLSRARWQQDEAILYIGRDRESPLAIRGKAAKVLAEAEDQYAA
jgi:hypothetical protein